MDNFDILTISFFGFAMESISCHGHGQSRRSGRGGQRVFLQHHCGEQQHSLLSAGLRWKTEREIDEPKTHPKTSFVARGIVSLDHPNELPPVVQDVDDLLRVTTSRTAAIVHPSTAAARPLECELCLWFLAGNRRNNIRVVRHRPALLTALVAIRIEILHDSPYNYRIIWRQNVHFPRAATVPTNLKGPMGLE